MTGVWVLLATLVVATAAGLVLHARNGRIRAAKPAARPRPLPAPVAEALDPESAVTLVQISTTFCTPCRHTRAILSSLAEKTDGLHHVDLDVTERPEVAQALSVLSTPTTLALDPEGRELLRVGGVPKGPELLEALRPHLTAASH
ncbi:TlpA family protein disulfide reductase [Amycolatopsis echigonensis]|uniref:Thioredoxin n=1 Tax=Amycolatopsis echigonensis TaxID=2576905 RepID=A0A2N3WHI5_9PSEU|nr:MULTISPECIES: thioredoxin family protein [Amycolatopsis]MBB2501689.1 thioredoxin family protein [Amycolatopsis echigonensis]PKV93338.1 thioredoxin [Amycolatopsis niigatensis]